MGQSDGGCGYVTVECTLECGSRIERRQLREHVESSCPHRTVEYQISRLEKRLAMGLAETATKIDALTVENTAMKEEIKQLKMERNSTREQVILLEATLADTKDILSTKCEALNAENKIIKEEIKTLKQSLKQTTQFETHFAEMRVTEPTVNKPTEIVDSLYAQSLVLKEEVDELNVKQTSTRRLLDELSRIYPTPPFSASIPNITRRARENDVYQSKPFYSHQGGYKMGLVIYPNGEGKHRGNYFSVYMHILTGEYDDTLRWPFKGAVTIRMLRSNLTWDFEKTMTLDANTDYGCVKKPVNELSNQLWGFGEWVSKQELKRNFMIRDTVALRVTHVRVD